MLQMRQSLAAARRIVVKLGTQVIAHEGGGLALGRLMSLVESIANLRRDGVEVVLVASGAVGMGMRELKMKERPRSLGLRQACAAVGQGHLMGLFSRAFAHFDVPVGQVLLTQDDLIDRRRALSVRTTLTRLIEVGAVPIINENDSVSVRELRDYEDEEGRRRLIFGDNDKLSAIVASALDADVLILLTDVAGMFDKNPKRYPDATRISHMNGITEKDKEAASGGVSAGGTGGMATKLEAAELATNDGTHVVIAGGFEPNVVNRILAGEDIGTFVVSQVDRGEKWRRIAISETRKGALIVNEGAIRALADKKASLLPIGVVSVDGNFEKGDLVEVRDSQGIVHGRGLVNYNDEECRRIVGQQSDDIVSILGYRSYDALITRNNLVLGTV